MVKKLILIFWFSFFLFFFFIVIHVWAVKNDFLGLYGGMPSLDVLENPKSELASELYSSDGVLLGKYFRSNRSPVEFEEISPNLINALVATEDIRFEQHSGIDMKGTFAIPFAILAGDRRGSSTLTQQLAKNLFKTREFKGHLTKVKGLKTLIIKTKEWITAVKLESSYSKREIITMYLNTVDFGSNAYGIKTAAKTFFNTTPDRLNVQQAAVLVGLLKAPSNYSPVMNPENSKNRRNTVLEQMQKYGFLTKIKCDSLKKTELVLDYEVENHNTGSATYFRTVVHNYLVQWCKQRDLDLYADGLKIYSTINSKAQKYAEEAVTEHMKYIQKEFDRVFKGKNPWIDENKKEIPNFIETSIKRTDVYRSLKKRFPNNPDSIEFYLNKKKKLKVFSWNGEKDTVMSAYDSLRYYKRFLNAGLISVNPGTGYIISWVGGIDHKYFKFDHVKQSVRQPGSTFKPFVYLAALDNGYSPCFEIEDVPVTFQYPNGNDIITWTPKNAEDVYTGKSFTLRQAMARSINSITANVMKRMGPENVVAYCRKIGFTSPLDPVPALCLGSSDVSIYELVGAYSTFANQGTYTEPQFILRIEDKNGNLIHEFPPKKKEALNPETAFLMCHMLMGGTQEKGGTALGLYRYNNIFKGNEVGGKTGTTSNYSDGWFVGVTPNLVAGVWVGGDDRCIHFTDFTFGQGARLALPIVGMYMDKVFGDPNTQVTPARFKRPENLKVEINCDKYRSGVSTVGDSLQPGILRQSISPKDL
ncbi:MAG: transglycosylase domain-containing protein [Cytophagales bacterium]